MTKSTAKKSAHNPEHDDLDDTLPLPALERMLKASEESLDGMHRSPGDTDGMLVNQLRRLVELAESIDGQLGHIADLLTKERTQNRRTSKASRQRTGKSK